MWARSQPMREDVTCVISPLIGWCHAQMIRDSEWKNGPCLGFIIQTNGKMRKIFFLLFYMDFFRLLKAIFVSAFWKAVWEYDLNIWNVWSVVENDVVEDLIYIEYNVEDLIYTKCWMLKIVIYITLVVDIHVYMYLLPCLSGKVQFWLVCRIDCWGEYISIAWCKTEVTPVP